MQFYFQQYKKNWYPKLFLGACVAVSITIPYPTIVYNNIATILLGFLWLTSGDAWLGYKNYFRGYLVAALLFYICYVYGVSYSANGLEAGIDLERKIPLLLFPLILLSAKEQLTPQLIFWVLLSFVLTCIFLFLFCIANAYMVYIYSQSLDYFFYHDLSIVLNLHAIYFSMHLAFALLILLYWAYFHSKNWRMWQWTMMSLGSLILSLGLLLLGGRIVQGALVIILMGFVTYSVYQQPRYRWYILLATFVLTVLTVGIVLSSETLKKRFTELTEKGLVFDAQKNNASGWTLRQAKWRCAMEIWQQNFWWGVGTGDVQDNLQKCYEKNNFWGHVFRFNTHNQYLETAVALGLIGLLILLSYLGIIFYEAVAQKNTLLLSLITLLSVSFITEAMLNRQKAIVLMAFFVSLLLSYASNSSPSNQPQ